MKTSTISNYGILAIWNDCAPEKLERFEEWYQTEHLIERLGVPGFLIGRRYESLEGSPGFFTYYETTSSDILTSEAYLERVNNPTPLTREIMSGTFTNMSRTVCQRVYRQGRIHGAYAITVRINAPFEKEQGIQQLKNLAADTSVAGAEIWYSAEKNKQEETEEERLRGGDKKIQSCLLIETLRESDAQRISATLQKSFYRQNSINTFRFLCSLSNEGESL